MSKYKFCDPVIVTDQIGAYGALVLEQVKTTDSVVVFIPDLMGFHTALIPLVDVAPDLDHPYVSIETRRVLWSTWQRVRTDVLPGMIDGVIQWQQKTHA
jgi:hypothetical protein